MFRLVGGDLGDRSNWESIELGPELLPVLPLELPLLGSEEDMAYREAGESILRLVFRTGKAGLATLLEGEFANRGLGRPVGGDCGAEAALLVAE